MSGTVFEEEKWEDSIQLDPILYSDDEKKRSDSTSPSRRRKVCIYVLFASVLTALIGLNIKFALLLISRNASDQNVDIWRSLIISDGENLYALEMDSKSPSLLQTSKYGIAAFDVYSNETVLWNECRSSTIQPISKSYKSIEGTEIWLMQAIAVDEVNKLFYIIDKSAGTLSVFDVRTGTHGIVFSDLVRAHDLALDPASGLMFILQQYDSILRSDMDGTSRREVVQDSDVSAFVIDRERRFIYYASKSKGIRVVDYEARREIKTVKVFVEIILSLALFQNQLFWTSLPNSSDTSNSELWSCNIVQVLCHNATRREISLKNPRAIKASPILQPVENPCESNANCDQLCLLASNNGYSCACSKGWYLHPSSGLCLEMVTALTYVQGNYIRAKHPDNALGAFSDIILPRSFYTESLTRKSSIDYTYGTYNFYISDDTAIYSLNKSSEAIDGDQKKIFTVDKGSHIRNIEFDIVNEYLYYVDENSIGEQSIAVLSLVTGEPAQKTKVKSQVDVFLIGALYSLLYSPNWDEVFGPSSSSSGFSSTEKPIANDHFSKTSRLRYFHMHEMVSLDLSGDRICWISNTSVTKIEYLHFNPVELKYFGRGVLDLPIMINPISLAMGMDWMFVANFTGIWRFGKLDGHGAVQVAGYLGRDEKQMVSHAKIGIYESRDRYTRYRRLQKHQELEIQIGV